MFIIKPYQIIYRHRTIILSTTWNDIRLRFAGSILGLFWLILYPLLLLTAYSIVYLFIFRVRFADLSPSDYVLLIFSGLIPFLGFTEGIATTIPAVSSNSALVKNTLFPIDILPAKAVLVSQCTQAVGFLILLVALAVCDKLTVYSLLIVPIWAFQLLLGMGLGWILSACNVFFKDLQNIVTLIIIFLMMISPIAYPVDMVPEGLRPLLQANILYYYITAYQDSLVVGCFPRQNVLPVLMGASLFIFLGGYWFFSKIKTVFADNV